MARITSNAIYFSLAIFVCASVCTMRTVPSADTREQTTTGPLTPIVLIPGHGGNRIDAYISRETPVLPGCPAKSHGWVQCWLNLWDVLAGTLDCWAENNKLTFDPETGKYSDVQGLLHRVPGWGQLETMEYLDPSWTAYLLGNVGSYLAPFIRTLESWGYRRGLNLVGAPYDFRYAPPNMPDFYEPLRELIEDTYSRNGDAKVALVSHSMGGLLAYYFLEKQSAQWKETYVHSLTTMSTPWRGSPAMVEAILSGYTWGFDRLQPNKFRRMQRTCTSGVFLLPSPSEWRADEVLVQTPARNYTVTDYSELFRDGGYPLGGAMWESIRQESLSLNNPGVRMLCAYGSGKETPDVLVYEEGRFPDGPPRRVMGDGDGTANLRSASACRQWGDDLVTTGGANNVVTLEIQDASHNGVMTSPKLHEMLKALLLT